MVSNTAPEGLPVSLNEFLAAFFPDAQEPLFLRSFHPDRARREGQILPITRHKLVTEKDLRRRLRELNQQHGIYFVVNAGGNTDAHITRYNAFFCESDTASIAAQHDALDAAPVRPSVRVVTRKSVHAYWLVSGECTEAEWRDIQARLIAHFDGDNKIKNPSRVMRLPRFQHIHWDSERQTQTTTPVVVTDFAPDVRYTVAQMQAAFRPPTPPAGAPPATPPAVRPSPPQEFATHDARHTELTNRVMLAGRRNAKGHYDARARCHNGKGASGLVYFPSSGAVSCNAGCDYFAILRGFGLPDGALPKAVRPQPVHAPPAGASAGDAAATPEVALPDWGQPVPLPEHTPDAPSLDSELLPVGLRAWLADCADRMQCPLDFVAVPALVAVATVIGNRFRLCPKRYDDGWQVVPNLWGAIIGKPGVMKSPALNAALEPLRARERQARNSFEQATSAYEFASLVSEAKKGALKESLKKEVAQGREGDYLREQLDALKVARPVEGRYIVNDPTVEKLGMILNENPRGVMLFRDELTGWFKTLEKQGRESDRKFYLEAWNGYGWYTYDRVGRGTLRVENLTLSLLGGMQPGPLAAYISAARRDSQDDDGLLARFQLLTYPATPAWELVDRAPRADALEYAHQLFAALDELRPEHCVPNAGEYAALHFDNEAQEVFYSWWADLEKSLRRGAYSDVPLLEQHISKYRSLLPSLALLFHLCDFVSAQSVTPGLVGLDAITKAWQWCDLLTEHARSIYSLGGQAQRPAQFLLARLREGALEDAFTARDVYRKGWAGLTQREETQAALERLCDYGWLSPIRRAPDGLGRPTVNYLLHPTLHRKKEV